MVGTLEGIFETPVLLIAPRTFLLPDDTREDAFQDALKRFAQRFDLLQKNGCDVQVLGATKDTSGSHGYWRFIEEFERLRPSSIIRLDVNNRSDMLATIWPRDVFQVYGTLVISTPGYERKTKEILSKLGIPVERLEVLSSDLGQGGYVVRDKDLLVLSSRVSQDQNIPNIINRGYQIYFLPVPEKNDKGTDIGRRMSLNYHIDTEFNLVLSRGGTPLICVNEAYYSSFREHVDSLVEATDGKLHKIPEDSVDSRRGAINFIKLPNGKVMLPDYCVATQTFLEKGLGRSQVLIAKIDIFNDYSGPGGGLRCMSNLIE